MCLSTIKPNLKKEVAKLKIESDGYIWLAKTFNVRTGFLTGACREFEFYKGKNTAKGGIIGRRNNRYKAGFHCYLTKKAARTWYGWQGWVKVKPEWITAIGFQNGGGVSAIVVVCKHIII